MTRRFLCLAFLLLALDRLRREHELPRDAPIATFARRSGGRRIVLVSAAAYGLGVRSGMTVSAAKARATALRVWEEDAAADRRVLTRIGVWAMRFGPAVGLLQAPALHDGGKRARKTKDTVGAPAVVVEIGGSAALFGGEATLVEKARAALGRNGVGAGIAVADTVGAAYAMAVFRPESPAGTAAQERPRRLASGEEVRALGPLPIACLRLPDETRRKLASLGIHDIAALCALPRTALAERFGPLVPERLAQAFGEVLEALEVLRIETSFTRRIEFSAPTDRSEAVLRMLSRLSGEASRWLIARGLGARGLALTVEGDDGTTTSVTVALALPRRGRSHLLRLLQEKLVRTAGPTLVAALGLTLTETTPLADRQRRLLHDPDAKDDDDDGSSQRLIARLVARLGERNVLRAELVPDPRPERAYRLVPATRPRRASAETRRAGRDERPILLVRPPETLTAGEARPVRGPERIAAGWWEGDGVPRDFFTVEARDGRRLWAEKTEEGWRVHGRFA